jgi:hypothetical protein
MPKLIPFLLSRRLALAFLSRRLPVAFLSLCLPLALLAQDDCSDAAILAKRGSWKMDADVGSSYTKSRTTSNRYLDSIGKLLQATVPEPKGIEARWYRSMGDARFPGWPDNYTCNSLYFCWYCNKDLHRLMLGTETGTWAYVFVNHLDWFFGDRPENTALKTATEGFPIFTLPQKVGTWKGYDLYQSSVHAHGLCVVITRRGLLPWKPVTQEEYLKTVRVFLLDQEAKMNAPPPKMSDAEFQHQIDNINKSPYLKPEEKQKMLDNIRNQQQRQAQPPAGANPTRNKYVDDQVQVIDNYLNSTPAGQLQEQAILSQHSTKLFDGKFSPAQTGAHALVTLNPAYLDRQLKDNRPQWMILYWRWVSDNPASLNFKQQFEADFPVEKLQAMLDH